MILYSVNEVVCVLDGNSLGHGIYEVYWPYLVTSFGTVSRVASKQQATLLLYLAKHFASAGNVVVENLAEFNLSVI